MLAKNNFSHKLARLLRSSIRRQYGAPIFHIQCHVCGWVLLQIKSGTQTNYLSIILKYNQVNNYVFHMIIPHLMLIALNGLSIFKLNVDCTKALYYKSKVNRYSVYIEKKETRQEGYIHF